MKTTSPTISTYLGLLLWTLTACAQGPAKNSSNNTNMNPTPTHSETKSLNQRLDTATFGAGCFWCVEAVFQQVKGVEKVISGFSGGQIKNPSYKEVCNGTTGHAEVAQIIYNPDSVTFAQLLEVFWKVHDPTTLNRQGNDIGTQYRSVIFYHSQEQKETAEKIKQNLNESKAWDHPVVTEISPFVAFYKAEDYHQDYYNQNGNQPYCQYVIQPKVEKFKKAFEGTLLKK